MVLVSFSLSKPPTMATIQPCTQEGNTFLYSHSLKPLAPTSSWLGTAVICFPPQTLYSNYSAVSSGVICSLPTTKLAMASSSDKVPRWSMRAIKSFAMGELEGRKLKHQTTGTEAILMGILNEGTSLASKFLRANGVTLLKVREETVKLVGKADMYSFSPEHPPLTEAAQRAIDSAVERKLKSGDSGEITISYVLLGIWSEVGSPGHKIMETLGFSEEKAKELESLCSKAGSHVD